MYYLELTGEEIELLKSSLDYRLKEMRIELVHTENREFYRAIRDELEKLEKIESRICSLVETGTDSIAI